MPGKVNKKRRLAIRLMTQKEISEGLSPYDSNAWWGRSMARREKEIAKRNNDTNNNTNI